ncbi:phosphate/phosphite/phosphonate ABC transporter, periplasmic binding family protein [Mycolicibacterium hassiacum DSM 44199]|jgi:phosphonate transport system substrate-binding protein|uniref:Phosphate/phosphite/phosphonate ABC transporter, periplasmic binding family protein n=2 Tax=Mycolicibacterium hassiacum TaxID=46351 RepID=K5B8E2_MYCHD|nr:phosphate/phosphite/phosphonate ABC transporter substrate-binding protein [Mycolicibacterium hassiacum]EKF23543.1 phosphate/phosphite/phosphonate ABC transporter, periplasmic binding family protein [Mycolicibacterium hassiacum DSM 44199]MBX5486989.1 phosphate/phosphite/phosphonate ABC transporter substrate-binding protein [Mycolicibacterium hassiacum]MDA4084794.1 phosphonate ABC transporter substrate-binding protein [Mycolicibacterium hassiacum DSM 44199]PZN10909.1 MAG: phosphate/phosphite/p
MSVRGWIARASIVLTAAAVSTGLTAGCGTGDPAGETRPGTVRLAVTDLQGLEELQREFGAFKTEFEKHSGLQVEFFAVSDRTAAAAALQAGRVDVVFTGPAEYVVIHDRTGAEPIVAIERDGYHSTIYTRADTGITNLEQLRGKKIAMSDVGSTSGHLGPSQMLVDAGLTPGSDVEVLTVGDTVHEALRRGDVDAVGIGHHDYEEFMATDDPDRYRILAEGPILPPDLLIARPGLDEQTVATIRQTLTDHFDVLLAAMLEGKDNAKYENAKLVNVTDADYDTVRSMYRAVGVDDFSRFLGD